MSDRPVSTLPSRNERALRKTKMARVPKTKTVSLSNPMQNKGTLSSLRRFPRIHGLVKKSASSSSKTAKSLGATSRKLRLEIRKRKKALQQQRKTKCRQIVRVSKDRTSVQSITWAKPITADLHQNSGVVMMSKWNKVRTIVIKRDSFGTWPQPEPKPEVRASTDVRPIDDSLYSRLCAHKPRTRETVHALVEKQGNPIFLRADSVDMGCMTRPEMRPKSRKGRWKIPKSRIKSILAFPRNTSGGWADNLTFPRNTRGRRASNVSFSELDASDVSVEFKDQTPPVCLESAEDSVDYFKEPLSVVFSEAQLDYLEKAKLAETSDRFAVEPKKRTLSVRKSEAQLVAPEMETVQLKKTSRALSQAKDVLSVQNSATQLAEPAKKVEEPVQLEQTSGDVTVQARKHLLSVHASAHQLQEPVRVEEDKPKLVEASKDLVLVVKEENIKLVSYGSQTQLSEVSKPTEEEPLCQLTETTSDHSVVQGDTTTLISDETTVEVDQLWADPVVLEDTENSLEVEEEYDWSYLWWYAGGVATYWLLKGKSHTRTERHHYHNSEKPKRK